MHSIFFSIYSSININIRMEAESFPRGKLPKDTSSSSRKTDTDAGDNKKKDKKKEHNRSKSESGKRDSDRLFSTSGGADDTRGRSRGGDDASRKRDRSKSAKSNDKSKRSSSSNNSATSAPGEHIIHKADELTSKVCMSNFYHYMSKACNCIKMSGKREGKSAAQRTNTCVYVHWCSRAKVSLFLFSFLIF